MFRSALLKLTGLYLLILMLICLLFSMNLYRISTVEVSTRLRRQADLIASSRFGNLQVDPDLLEIAVLNELENSQRHIIAQLIYANIVILCLGGVGSYLLAKRTLEPIEEAHAAQIRFTADASHELRTPLTAMRAETEVTLREKKLTVAMARKQLESNVEELERLTSLSENLLQLARGNDTSDWKAKVKLADVFTEAVKQIRYKAEQKKATINLSPTGAVVAGSPSQLNQLFVILLDNAIKYGKDGQTIRVSCKTTPTHASVSVKDEGVGISKKDLPHVFERFYRVDTVRNQTVSPGYGLGLSIAEKIVHSHGGDLEVSSKLDKGSTFTVILPIIRD